MSLLQIIYSSQPFGYDDSMLMGILFDARKNNERDGITGALVCRGDIYLQLLEGPEAKVQAALDRITRDDRHLSVTPRFSERVSERMFADWAMLHDPARTWLWTQDEIADGILERVTEDAIRDVFVKLAAAAASDQSQ